MNSHALRVIQRNFSILEQVIRQQKDLLCRGNHNVLWIRPGVDAAVGVYFGGIHFRENNKNSRLCRLLATRSPDFSLFDNSKILYTMVWRLELSSADPFTLAMAREILMDPPRRVAFLTSSRRSASRSGRWTSSFSSSFVFIVSSTSSSSNAVTVDIAFSSSTDVTVGELSSSAKFCLICLMRRWVAFDSATNFNVRLNPYN